MCGSPCVLLDWVRELRHELVHQLVQPRPQLSHRRRQLRTQQLRDPRLAPGGRCHGLIERLVASQRAHSQQRGLHHTGCARPELKGLTPELQPLLRR
jgi:predicted PP-loop superfamily ATPase